MSGSGKKTTGSAFGSKFGISIHSHRVLQYSNQGSTLAGYALSVLPASGAIAAARVSPLLAMTLQACRPRILEGLFLDDNDYKMPTMISGPEDFKQLMHLIERKIIMSYLPSRSNETEIIFPCTWIPSARLRICKTQRNGRQRKQSPTYLHSFSRTASIRYSVLHCLSA